MSKEVQYSEYLQLDKILGAQDRESVKHGQPAHDEMLFIIIHQSYELWFKQILFEIESIAEILNKPMLNDNGPEMATVIHRLDRVVVIMRVLVQKVDILETMSPMDFLDFRDMLRPASGFQSWQFKVAESRLGLKFEERHGQQYYISQLKQEHIDLIKAAEKKPTILELVNQWLERMPGFGNNEFWKNYKRTYAEMKYEHPFWNDYSQLYASTLVEGEKQNMEAFSAIFFDDKGECAFSSAACRSALFIMLYRDRPLLQLPWKMLNTLLEIDNLLATWRFRHINMVHRMIGSRVGTGGSSGKDYLQGALNKHYIFKDLARLTSFLIERKKLPVLSKDLEAHLSFLAILPE